MRRNARTLASDTVRTLLIDREDRVWVGTELHGLDVLDPRAGREACIAAGMDDYLGKPFSRATLHAVLTRWLTPREHAILQRT